MPLTFRLSLLLAFCFSSVSLAYTPLNTLPQGSRTSLVVESLAEQKSLLSTNTEQYFPPASTLKVVTALAAKLELADDFKFETRLEQFGNNWVVRFAGDPTLQTGDLKTLFTTARSKGLKRVKGDIWLDNSAFTGYDRAVGWPWDILGVCYSAPASAVTLDGNCVQASIYTEKQGKTRVYVPPHYPVHASTEVRAVSEAEQESYQCDLELESTANNHYRLKGCLQNRKKPLPLKFAVQNPELYTQKMLGKQLAQLGIKLDGQIQVGKPNATKTKLVANHYSKPLTELLEEMLKDSDNLIADNLTKTLGAKFYVQAGSFRNGTEAIKQIIHTRTGIDLSQMPLADGSGLSRNNRFTTGAMTQILHYIWKNDRDLQLIALMPTAGENGTLKYRRSMRKAPVKGAIVAKSGSLYGSLNMAGYGLDSSGKPNSLFVQYVADYHPEKPKTDKPVEAPITLFETRFYQDVVKFSHSLESK